MKNAALIPKPTSLWGKLKPSEDVKRLLFIILGVLVFVVGFAIFAHYVDEHDKKNAPDITILSMDFTVLNMTETRLSVKWDLLIRIPRILPGNYVCLEGDLKVFILYKGVTIATSLESYTLEPSWSKLLKVSLVASEGDMDDATVKNIVADIKERDELRFESRVLLPDCRSGTSGKMNYACDEAMLRFEPGTQRNATLFGNQPNCLYLYIPSGILYHQ